MKPTVPITDRQFVYVPSTHTNIALTFARVRAEQAAALERLKAGIAPSNVAAIKTRKA